MSSPSCRNMDPVFRSAPGLALVWLALGCSDVALRSPEERGQALFLDPALSGSSINRLSCETCHDARPDPSSGLIKPGAILAGATERESFWGGQELDLLRSINDCLRLFMLGVTPLEQDDPEAQALYAFLKDLPPIETGPIAFTSIANVDQLPRGDANRGASLYRATCQECHGDRHTGNGHLTTLAPVLPEQTHDEHATETDDTIRLSVIDKTRHGGFFGVGGIMPPFSPQTLSDEELSDILEYLEFFGDP